MDQTYVDRIKEWVKLDNIVTRNSLEIKTAKLQVETILDDKKRIEKEISVPLGVNSPPSIDNSAGNK